MKDKVRWGILSTAMINDVVIEAIGDSKRSELVGVASRSGERAKAYARERGIPKAYGSYEALLDDPDISAVYISVPNTLHAEWTVKAAEAKKHILCEKPIVTTLGDFDRIEAAALKNKAVLFEAFMYLHHPQTLKVRELLRSGRLGTVRFIESYFDYFLPREDTRNIRVDPSLDGGSLWDVGVYPNSFSVTMADDGAPVEVHAFARKEKKDGVDVCAYAQMKFKSGTVAQISASIRTPFRAGAHIIGDEGYLFIENPWKPGLDRKECTAVLTTSGGGREELVFPGIPPYHYEVLAMESCILDGMEPVVPLSLSRDFLRSMLALHKSASKGAGRSTTRGEPQTQKTEPAPHT
jgi:predicted dehydrogenase